MARVSGDRRRLRSLRHSGVVAWASIRVRLKSSILVLCGVGLAFAWLCVGFSRPSGLRLSVRFLGYTNIAGFGTHLGVVQISNASPFAVGRDRGPQVVFNSPSVPMNYATTGWSVLEPGEVEHVLTESLSNEFGWKMVICAQKLGDDPYFIAAEPKLRTWYRQFAEWLQSHGVRVRAPSSPPSRVFSTDWIDPSP
jgi:hypothetical protein